MKTRSILPFLALSLLPLFIMAQNWMPVKMNQKVWYLHKHATSYYSQKPLGITDSLAYGILRLNVNHRSNNGRYKTLGVFGVRTNNDYQRGPGYDYPTGQYVRHANFWFRDLDSLGDKLWLVNLLEDEKLVFSTAYPRPAVSTVTFGGTTYSIHYPTSKKDSVINGVQDSVLVYTLPTSNGASTMMLSKNHGLLRWREVYLWTDELRARTMRRFNYDYMANWGQGTRHQFLTTTLPMFAYGDSTLTHSYVHNNTVSGNVRTIDKTDTVYEKRPTSSTSFSLSVRVSRNQIQVPTEAEYANVYVPDSAEVVRGSFSRYAPLHRVIISQDTTKPWILADIGYPADNRLADTSIYHTMLDGSMAGTHWVEGMGESIAMFSAGLASTYYTRRLLYLENNSATIGAFFRFSTITSLADAQLQSQKLYPNPATTSISLENASTIPASYTILDAMGREVQQGNYEGNTISIENLPAGVYKLRMAGSSSTFVKQ